MTEWEWRDTPDFEFIDTPDFEWLWYEKVDLAGTFTPTAELGRRIEVNRETAGII